MAHRFKDPSLVKNRLDLSDRVAALLRLLNQIDFAPEITLRVRYGDDAVDAAKERGFVGVMTSNRGLLQIEKPGLGFLGTVNRANWARREENRSYSGAARRRTVREVRERRQGR